MSVGHEEREHKKFSPSGADRRHLCPGSVRQTERTPPHARSAWSDDGTTAHEILEAALDFMCADANAAIENSVHAGTEISDEIKQSVNDALDYIYQTIEDLQELYGEVRVYVERRVDTPSTVAPGEAGGVCDICIYAPLGRIIFVMDYKHGAGIMKSAYGNRQVKQYAGGFLYEDNAIVPASEIDIVVLCIIQPRSFHPDGDKREYYTTPAEICDYLMEMDADIERCLDPSAPLVPGLEQCRFCPAYLTCPAVEGHVVKTLHPNYSIVQDVRQSHIPDPRTIDPTRLGYILAAKPMIINYLNKCEAYAKELILQGYDVPGQKMVEVEAKREWYREKPTTTDEEIAVKLAAAIGRDVKPEELIRKKLITITDAQDMIVQAFKKPVARNKKKQAAEDALKTFAYFTLKKPSGNLTLVSADDPRPAVNKAEQMFSGIAGLIQPPERN